MSETFAEATKGEGILCIAHESQKNLRLLFRASRVTKGNQNMNQLYPIGTQLITKRLSQAALYVEVFGREPRSLLEIEPGIFKDFTGEVDFDADAWQVTVTEENQKWLSPKPLVGDLVLRSEEPCMPVYAHLWEPWQVHLFIGPGETIEKRTYPNGQRAPLIEWDEVIEPKAGEK